MSWFGYTEPMRLLDLSPEFLHLVSPGCHLLVSAIEDADGIMFLCPVCFRANGGAIGTHMIICWTPDIPLSEFPRPGRWRFEGTGYDDLTLVAGSSSILLTGKGCEAHFFIRNGQIVFA